MTTGNIGVKTENIFPVIKKFLYSDQEIFLREIISNAVDATQKLKALAASGEYKGELGDLTIKVEVDKKKKTLTVRDRGIGMNAEEVDKYINQIAFSGAEEFIAKFKTQSEAEAANIIGHFGLGFYSAFMVSSKVSLISKSCKEAGANGVIWECDGSPEYTMNEIPKGDRGTDVILYISDDAAEFLEEGRIRELLNKYCKFLPIPIQFGTRKVQEEIEGETDKDGKPKTKEVEKPWIINDVAPLWKKAPTDIKDEEYNDFYHVLYPMNFGEPLFHIHLNVDYPFNLTGILYFPKVKNRYEFHPLFPEGEEPLRVPAQQDTTLLQRGLRHRLGGRHPARVPLAAARRHRLARHPTERQPLVPAKRPEREENLDLHHQEGGRETGRALQERPRGLREELG